MKKTILVFCLFCCFTAKAQHIDSIYVNLYTDSLKKGTYNYINIDGLLSNGRYIPLDSTQILFTSSAGKFFGNELFVEPDFPGDKITITVTLRKNPALKKEFDMYIKKLPDGPLKSNDEFMNELKGRKKTRNRYQP